MSVDLHRQAEFHMGRCDQAKSAGDYATAAVEIAHAGHFEVDAFKLVPLERSKTRGVLAISAVSCYLQAARYAARAGEAEARSTHRDTARIYRNTSRIYRRHYLGLAGVAALPDWARQQLETIEAETEAEWRTR